MPDFMNQKIFLAGSGLMLGLAPVFAQMPNAGQQADTVQQRRELEESAAPGTATNSVPELYAGESDDVGPQSVLRYKPHHNILTASVDSQYFYTDNMFLTREDRHGADVLVSTADIVLSPDPFPLGDGVFTPRVGYQHQWFNYGFEDNHSFAALNERTFAFETLHSSDFDFNVETAFADGSWRWRNWIVSGGMDYRRLMDSDRYDQFYTEFVPRWSLQRVFDLTATTSLSLGYEGDFRITDTDLTAPGLDSSSNNRSDQSAVVVGSWKLGRHAVLQPYYRFEFSHYTGIHRDDYFNSAGLAVYVALCKNAGLRAFVDYDNLATDGADVQGYDNLTAGGGFSLTVGF